MTLPILLSASHRQRAAVTWPTNGLVVEESYFITRDGRARERKTPLFLHLWWLGAWSLNMDQNELLRITTSLLPPSLFQLGLPPWAYGGVGEARVVTMPGDHHHCAVA